MLIFFEYKSNRKGNSHLLFGFSCWDIVNKNGETVSDVLRRHIDLTKSSDSFCYEQWVDLVTKIFCKKYCESKRNENKLYRSI